MEPVSNKNIDAGMKIGMNRRSLLNKNPTQSIFSNFLILSLNFLYNHFYET